MAQKEARHMQQMLVEHEEKIAQVVSDVEVLKKNQMQLANTIQVLPHSCCLCAASLCAISLRCCAIAQGMHAQSIAMQSELSVSAEKLDALFRGLAMHNVDIETPGDGRRDREAAR